MNGPIRFAAVSMGAALLLTGLSGTAESYDVKKLYREAKKEGRVSFQGTLIKPSGVALVKAFSKKFKGIKAAYRRSGTAKTVARVRTQRRAGKVSMDVLNISDKFTMNRWAREGFTAKFVPKGAAKVYKGLKDPNGFWHSIIYTPVVWSYNTKKYKGPVPQKWADILDPRFNNIMSAARPWGYGLWYYVWADLHDRFGIDYLKKLAATKPILTKGAGGAMRLMISGERPFDFTTMGNRINRQIAKGQPVKFIIPKDYFIVYMVLMTVVNKAKNPNAARLLAHYALSKEGQKVIINKGFQHSSRKDIKPRKGTTYVPFTDPRFSIPQKKKYEKEHDKRIALYEKIFGLK